MISEWHLFSKFHFYERKCRVIFNGEETFLLFQILLQISFIIFYFPYFSVHSFPFSNLSFFFPFSNIFYDFFYHFFAASLTFSPSFLFFCSFLFALFFHLMFPQSVFLSTSLFLFLKSFLFLTLYLNHRYFLSPLSLSLSLSLRLWAKFYHRVNKNSWNSHFTFSPWLSASSINSTLQFIYFIILLWKLYAQYTVPCANTNT